MRITAKRKSKCKNENGGAAGRQAALDMDKVFPQRDRGHKPLFLPVVRAGQNAVVFLRDCRRSKYFVIQFLLGICKVEDKQPKQKHSFVAALQIAE